MVGDLPFATQEDAIYGVYEEFEEDEFSKELEDLFKGIFTVDPKYRLTIHDINKSEWLNFEPSVDDVEETIEEFSSFLNATSLESLLMREFVKVSTKKK